LEKFSLEKTSLKKTGFEEKRRPKDQEYENKRPQKHLEESLQAEGHGPFFCSLRSLMEGSDGFHVFLEVVQRALPRITTAFADVVRCGFDGWMQIAHGEMVAQERLEGVEEEDPEWDQAC